MIRFDKALLTGAAVSGALIAYGVTARHARVVAVAAQQHTPPSHFLIVAFCGMTMLFTIVAYLILPSSQ